MPAKQPKRGRLWLNDGSCVRLRPEHPNHVWSYDFVEDRTHDGRKYRMLNVDRRVHPRVPGDPGEPQAELGRRHRRALGPVHPARRARAHPLRQRAGVHRQGASASGSPRSGRRPPTSSPAARGRTATARASTASCATSCERRDLLLKEAKVVIEGWRRHYNTIRPHSSLGYRPPAPEAMLWPAPQPDQLRRPPRPWRQAAPALTFNPDHPWGPAKRRLAVQSRHRR